MKGQQCDIEPIIDDFYRNHKYYSWKIPESFLCDSACECTVDKILSYPYSMGWTCVLFIFKSLYRFQKKKALSEIFLMALLPLRSWRELKEIDEKYKEGNLKGHKPSLSEVLSTASMKQIHLRCLSGLTPEERYQLLAQASPLLSCNQISFHLLFFPRIFPYF